MTTIDTRPICLVCGWLLEETGDYNEIELDGGFAGIVEEPIYMCSNPDCCGFEDCEDYEE